MNKITDPEFHHAIRFRADLCTGCSHCMNSCPTEAIRVSHGKASMLVNRCIDCGVCYSVCPVGAIMIEQDDFDTIFNFTARVALVPAVFTGQFPEYINTSDIQAAIGELGFTHIFEVEEGADFLADQINHYIHEHQQTKPLISSFCPAVVRLIQVKFPTLTSHIILLKAPVDITALKARTELARSGFSPNEIGIFYITPCAAKIVAVKNPVGESTSAIDGVINLNCFYNKVFKILRQNHKKINPIPPVQKTASVCWSLTGGETDQLNVTRGLAIDEIKNVIEFLEKVENEEITGIDFLELRACDESCAGGILCPENRFLTVEKLRKRAIASQSRQTTGNAPQEQYNFGADYTEIKQHIILDRVLPRSILKLDNEVPEAMIKMKRMYELNSLLPQVDCGICGSPSCKALADDIVRLGASLTQCIFVQRVMEQNEQLDVADSVNIMRSIWSDNKLDRYGLKDEIIDFP